MDLHLLRGLEVKLSFKVGEEIWAHISEVVKKNYGSHEVYTPVL